ncbi:PTS system N-acetylgalactosamine-specific transporter subunit IID [Escherichia coli]|uniref:PTS system N-acetylgalactosamine-specific transporter subunit IID n=1 Tax=Escherichia coli TaxID=562 RepID=A0A3S4NRH0_ECOLX|nr:PTS system N-acetylgalactosamine-specific transporter subunit IID [Escherichia coli]
MPAIGFAVLLKIMMKNVYIPYFILGFVAAAWLKLPVLAIAAAALAMALIDLLRKSPEPTQPAAQKRNLKMASNQTTLPNVSENEETLLTGVNENVYEDQSIGTELTKKDINRVAWRSMLLQSVF